MSPYSEDPLRPVIQEDQDCTTAMLQNRQSMVVNQQQATIVGEYLNAIVNIGTISMYMTDIVTAPTITVRSKPITIYNIATDTGLSPAFLRGEEKQHGQTQA